MKSVKFSTSCLATVLALSNAISMPAMADTSPPTGGVIQQLPAGSCQIGDTSCISFDWTNKCVLEASSPNLSSAEGNPYDGPEFFDNSASGSFSGQVRVMDRSTGSTETLTFSVGETRNHTSADEGILVAPHLLLDLVSITLFEWTVARPVEDAFMDSDIDSDLKNVGIPYYEALMNQHACSPDQKVAPLASNGDAASAADSRVAGDGAKQQLPSVLPDNSSAQSTSAGSGQ